MEARSICNRQVRGSNPLISKNSPNFWKDFSYNAKINFIQEDILKAQALNGNWDVIVSNPPYVRELEKKEMQRNVLEYEPETALYVKDEDPLLFYNKITRLAKESLNPGGNLYFEINQYLADETEKMMQEQGFVTEKQKDIFGNYRMLKGIAHNI